MRNNKGSALLLVLVSITFMIMISSLITTRFNRAYFVVNNNMMHSKARWYVDGIEGVIKKYMRDEFNKNKEKIHAQMVWAQPDQVIPMDEAIITGNVVDEMSCINLNGLLANSGKQDGTNGQQQEDPLFATFKYPALVFKNLLEIMGADEQLAEKIVASSIDWIDTDSNTYTAHGAEDHHYSNNNVMPHLANNYRFYDKTELRQIYGMTDELYRRIEHMVCVLPNNEFKISVNLMDKRYSPLISALMLKEISVEDAARILEERPDKGWNSANDFIAISSVNDRLSNVSGLRNHLANSIVVNSNYFLANIIVSFENEKFAFKTRFFRNDSNTLSVYQRLVGELYE